MSPIPGDSRRRLRSALRPRRTRAQLVVALLCAMVGFALAVQVGTSSSEERRTARPEELVRILDDLGARSARLRAEVDTLRATRDRLAGGGDRTRAALEEARRRAEQLGILAGTLPAYGPGVTLTITDPAGKIRADVLLDAVQELRDAGAEALQIAGRDAAGAGKPVRIVVSTALLDDAQGGVRVDGAVVRPPYRITAIGDAATLTSALGIPGGVVDTVAAREGARAEVTSGSTAAVTALHRLATPRYARPAPPDSGGG